MMSRRVRLVQVVLVAAVVTVFAAPARAAQRFEISRIFIEFNQTDNDLGFHVSLDAEDWKTVQIVNPNGVTIFQASGKGPYGKPGRGLSEMFFEGAEPSLDDVRLEDLLAQFPEGTYRFLAVTADGVRINGSSNFTHAVPDGPVVSTEVGSSVVIRWRPVTGPPPGFPSKRINIVGYQVIVDPFQVTLPATATQVTLPKEFVDSL